MKDKQSPTVRVSPQTFEKLFSRKLRLEKWLESASVAQVQNAFLPNPRHDRFGVSLDTIIRRLLRAAEQRERRCKQSRIRRRKICKKQQPK